MLGVCLGNRGNPFDEQTCDAHRENTPLNINIFLETSIYQIKYSMSDGRMRLLKESVK